MGVKGWELWRVGVMVVGVQFRWGERIGLQIGCQLRVFLKCWNVFCVLPNIVPCPGVWHPVAQSNGWFYSHPPFGQGSESAVSGVLGSLLVIQDLRHSRRKGRDSYFKALLLSKCLESWSIMRFAWDKHAQGSCGGSLSDQPPGLFSFWGGIRPWWALGRQSRKGLGLQYRFVLMIMRC